MINNRQAGRRRGRGNNGGGGNAPRQGGQGRPDNGNRIDNRARGNASQLHEKYKTLAADAQRQGDRVNTEYYLQFADHYFRVIADQRGRFEDQQPRRQQTEFDGGEGDEDYGDEGEPIRTGEQGTANADRQDRYERQDRGDRQDRPERQERGERPYRAEGQDRQDRPERGERPYRAEGQERPRAERPERADRPERAARPDGDRPRRWDRDDRPQRTPEPETEIAGQRRADPPVAGEDLAARAETVLEADAPLQNDVAPRRRGRPRRDAAIEAAVEVDGNRLDAPESNGVDADRLPPSLGIAAANDADDGEPPRPRRRRVRAVGTDDVSAG